MGDAEQQFRRFIERARALRGEPAAPSEAFRRFVAKATPLATAHVRRAIDDLAAVGPALFPWLVEHDLLAVAGYAWVETAYTSLAAWALYPPGREDVALACQRAWAKRVAPGIAIARAVKPAHQLVTDDGIPDLVFEYDDDVLIVEAKTKTVEHATPSGKPQTSGYLESVARRLRVDPERCHIVYLTPARATPASERAYAASYAELAVTLASALGGVAEDDALFAPYAMLITHLVRCSLPNRIDAADLLERICRFSREPSGGDGAEILRDLGAIQILATALLPAEEP